MAKRHTRIGMVVVSLAVVAAACAPGGTDSGLRGQIIGDGSSTVFPITEAVAEEFRRENNRVDIKVSVSGTGGGFKKFCSGETDLQDASRRIKDSERAACAAENIDYIELQVANDGLAIVANKLNTWVNCLTTDQLRKIWEPRSKIDSWDDLNATYPNEPLKLFGPGTDSGTFDYFTDQINGEEGASRTDYTASEDDNTLVTGVSGSKGGLAYFGFAYYSANIKKGTLKLLGVDGGSGCVTPSDETVKENTYSPLSRPLFMYVKKASLRRPEVKAFITFYLDNVNLLLTDVGYTPLSEETLADQVAEFRAAAGV